MRESFQRKMFLGILHYQTHRFIISSLRIHENEFFRFSFLRVCYFHEMSSLKTFLGHLQELHSFQLNIKHRRRTKKNQKFPKIIRVEILLNFFNIVSISHPVLFHVRWFVWTKTIQTDVPYMVSMKIYCMGWWTGIRQGSTKILHLFIRIVCQR